MKIIDILNKKANGTLEDGFKFCYENKVFTYNKNTDSILYENSIRELGEKYIIEKILNDEALLFQEEIKESEKIEENKEIELQEKDKKILNNLINKKQDILEFKEIKAIVKLLLEIDKKTESLIPTELHIEN